MKIGVFTESYKPVINGVSTSVDAFREELARLGHEVYVFAPRFPGYDDDDDEHIVRCASFRIPTHGDYPLAIPSASIALRAAARIGLDLVHVQTPFILGHIGYFVAGKLSIPRIFTYHTLYAEYAHYAPFQRGLVRRFLQSLSRNFCNGADVVLTPSSVIKDVLHDYGVKRPIRVMPTGIDTEFFRQADAGWARQRYAIGSDETLLLFVGRLAREKNVDYLLRAFRIISSTRPDCKLMIVSGGPEENNLKIMATALGIASKTIFCGYMSRSDLAKCYAAADAFLFSSRTETQGLVVLESMAAGTPVIAMNAMGVMDFVRNDVNGFLVDGGEDDFAGRTLCLLNDQSLRQRLTAAGLQTAEQFSIARCTERLAETYRDALTVTDNCRDVS